MIAQSACPLTFQPAAAPDWDGARTRRFALRNAKVEFVQGCEWRQDDGWWRHRVDSPYEGLLALIDGENWKCVDHFAFQVRDQGAIVPLEPDPITLDPLLVRARLSSAFGVWVFCYQVGDAGTLELTVGPPDGLPAGVTLHVRPVFDLRHMYGYSPADLAIEVLPGGRVAVSTERTVLIETQGARFRLGLQDVRVLYALGSGFRRWADDGIRFEPEARTCKAIGEWVFDSGPCRLVLAADLDAGRATRRLDSLAAAPDSAIEALAAERQALAACHDLAVRRAASPGVGERVFVMAHRFGMDAADCRLPEAGGWWFRTPWFRDVFEGYLSNRRTLDALGLSDRVRAACEAAARLIDPTSGRVPNRLPERNEDTAYAQIKGRLPDGFYHSVDATTLLFTLLDASEGQMTGDDTVFVEAFRLALSAFRHARPDKADGQAVIGPDGLLWCVPWHSWTDGKRSITFNGARVDDLPLRVPRAWQIQALEEGESPYALHREQRLPRYCLPETNAQWLRMLDWGLRHLPKGDPLVAVAARTLERAEASFRQTFWNEEAGTLFNLVRADGRADSTIGSPALVATVLVSERRGAGSPGVGERNPRNLANGLLDPSDLTRIWGACRDRLAVYRGAKLFGVQVKDSRERIYLGDEQYHEAVCWPRDSAYLVRLLRLVGEFDLAAEVLASNLAHQSQEGVIFYNQELFSLPEGPNPSPEAETADFPVPVKNPIQWWSQWCDAFLYNGVDDPLGSEKG